MKTKNQKQPPAPAPDAAMKSAIGCFEFLQIDCGSSEENWQQMDGMAAIIRRHLPDQSAELAQAREEIARLRGGLSKVATNIGNGSAASPDCSIGFLCDDVPGEVRLEIAALKSSLAAAVKERDEAQRREQRSDEVIQSIVQELPLVAGKDFAGCVVDLRDKLAAAEAQNGRLRKALNDAATSLYTISQQAGRTEELRELSQIRGYAFSRYSAVFPAVSARGKEGEK